MPDSPSAPTQWLSASADPAAQLPPEGPSFESAPAPPNRQLSPAPMGRPAHLAARPSVAALPIQSGAAPGRGLAPVRPAVRPQPRTQLISPQPVGEISQDFGGHLLGFSTLAVSIGAIVGTRYGGMYGGVAGSLFGGSLVNIYRAVRFAMDGSPEADREVAISGTYALAAAGFGGAVIYKLDRKRRLTPNSSSRYNGRRSCDFRPTGP